MGFRDLPAEEVSAVLASERVIRVAFDDGEERYLIPLFYVWHEGALHGLTTPGRKTAMASARPRVTFQIDTSARTGEFAWQSVTGEGTGRSSPMSATSPSLRISRRGSRTLRHGR